MAALKHGSMARGRTTLPSASRLSAVVRHEYFGSLIWSDERKRYYLPRTPADQTKFVQSLRERGTNGPGLVDRHDQFTRELRMLGLDGEIREIASPFTDRLSGPLEIYFDYTWACNLAKERCAQDSFCYASEFLGPTTMPADRVRALMFELSDWGVMRIHLAGGEPTINRRALSNYLDSATAAGLYTSMATNGLLINDRILDILLRNDLKSVSFSVDGATEITNARIRGPGLFDRAIEGIRLTIKRRDQYGSTMRVCIKPTYSPSTPDSELEDMVKLAIDLGVDVIKFANPERCLGHSQGHYGNSVDAYYQKIFLVQKLQHTFGSRIIITNVTNPLAGCGDIGIPGLAGCIGAQELLAINPNGNCTPCLMHPFNLGNVLTEYDGLRDFWSRAPSLPVLWSALAKPDACRNCRFFARCRSGSTVRRIVEEGRFDRERNTGEFRAIADPLCPLDLLRRRPELSPPPLGQDPDALLHFTEIAVRHSL
jgi:radical SAM protein with 4Fe4S-binding SPASM domain